MNVCAILYIFTFCLLGASVSSSSTGPVIKGPQSTLQENAVPLKQLLQMETHILTNDQLRMVIRTIVMGPGNYFGNDDLSLTMVLLEQLHESV